ncbi:MAG: SpoIIIAH-like family protein [Bacilli bacterium]|nr:SpoIIIAH-like family protein [Clostridium sp.]MDY6015938.1 SpoIIIAH-like family protein [Bacilli bacterium]
MINKQNLWFLTLFSLILVLSVYYVTMPNDLLLTNNGAVGSKKNEQTSVSKDTNTDTTKNEDTKKDDMKSTTTKDNKTDNNTTVTIKESETLEALRVSLNQEREAEKTKLQSLLTNSSATSEEKNNAYEKLQEINTVTSEEATLEKKLKEKYKMSVFVKIENKEITVVVDNDKHDTTLANNIMRSVQENFKEKRYITVQFK